MKKYVYPDNGKYIYKMKNSYQIIKHYESKGNKRRTEYFGSFKDYNEAIRYRDKCIENDWNMPKYENPRKYVVRDGNSWRIQRHYGGKVYSYGTYRNLTDALNERDLLIANDWDLEKVCELADDRIDNVTVMQRRV